VVAVAVAGGSYLWFRGQVKQANERVDPEVLPVLAEKPSSTIVTVPEPGSPSAMNLLVLGSDRRPDEDDSAARSDTIILVHVDPDNDYLSMLSLPRDLRVDVPGYGPNKLNFSFHAGGPALTIRTVEQVTGVDINHYVEVSFDAFKDITDSLGGVYVDVDQRYYNDNPNFELIKLSPGYQLLHGEDALDFVRYRHDLNLDFGRMERQQQFMSAMREQAMGWDLPIKLPGLVSSLFKNVATDLDANEVLKLAYWAVKLDGNRMRRISLIGDAEEVDGVAYVLATDNAIANAVGSFLTLPGMTASTTKPTSTTTTTATEVPDLAGIEMDIMNGNGRTGEAGAAGEWLSDMGATVVTVGNAEETVGETVVRYGENMSAAAKKVAKALGVSTDWSDSVKRVTLVLGEDFQLPREYALPPDPNTISAAGGWKKMAKEIPFAIEGPAYIPSGYYFVEKQPVNAPTYDIEVGGHGEPAFKMLYRLKQHGEWTDQYMGLMETTWLDAPAASKGREVEYEGRTLTIVGPADKVDRIWWKENGVLYWVSNTLFHLLSQDELLAVAQSMVTIPAE
jgi:polyisoprenyl-teichoic acid--peptidoglycan teichoic acid transferase